LSAAKSGANSDITSLAGLTTALSVAQGGTGGKTAAAALESLGGVGIAASDLFAEGWVKFVIPGTAKNFMIAWGTRTVAANSSASVTYEEAFTDFSIPIVSAT